jgi:colanic acid/amylovoran biosynthesis glycosyltransferase
MCPVVQFVSYDSPDEVGGVSSWLRKMVPWLRERGIDARVDLLGVGGRPGANAEWYRKARVPFRWSPLAGSTTLLVQQCLRWLREDMPQVYVPNCMLPAYFAAAEARRCGSRTIGVLHSDDPFYWALVDEFGNGGGKWRLDEWVVVSRFLHGALQSNNASAIPVHEIPYGVTIPKERAGRVAGKFRIIYTGRLVEEQKRISDLARAFCRVAREHSDLEAWIVGAGVSEGSVRGIIQAEGMEQRVIMKGRVEPEAIYEIVRACHAFVLLSDFEGTPLSLLEAMAVGLVPVCLETRSGVGEVITNMKNGILVRDREKSFSDAVSFLIRNPEAQSALSVAARQTIVERYSYEVCFEKWKALLLDNLPSVLGARQPRMRIRLPPRNSKLDGYDFRPWPFSRGWSSLRIALGYFRRKIMKSIGLGSSIKQ